MSLDRRNLGRPKRDGSRPAAGTGKAEPSAAGDEPLDTLTPSAELHRLVRGWRERLDPDRIPGLPANSHHHRKHVSQETMADLIGVSVKWYGHLERGEVSLNFSDEFLDRSAYALDLSDDERRVLYLLAAGHEPPAVESAVTHTVGPALRRVIETIPWPAWVSDQAWDRITENSAALAWFPHMKFERNIMRWVFFYPQSQRQLTDWETAWAPSMLAQMRAANAKFPGNARLTHIINESLEVNDFARRLWDTAPTVHVHPDGDRRRLRVPFLRDPIEVDIVAWAPLGSPDLRVVMLVPVDDATVLAIRRAQ